MADTASRSEPSEPAPQVSKRESNRSVDGNYAVPIDLFPLPLTPLEQYLILDDTPQQPLTIIVKLHFVTPLDLDRLKKAVATAVHRHPLIASRVIAEGKVWKWQYDPNFQPEILSVDQWPPVNDRYLQPMDLRREPGLRIWYYQRTSPSVPDSTGTAQGGRSIQLPVVQSGAMDASDSVTQPPAGTTWQLFFQMHHAAADGMGMRRFVVDSLIYYVRSFGAEPSTTSSDLRLDRIDHALLRERFCLKHLTDTPAPQPISAWRRAKNNYYFFCQPPVPLQGVQRQPHKIATAATEEPVVSLRLTAEETSAIIEKARQLEVGLNDVGLAMMFQLCRDWHQQHSVRGPKKRIRLLMPVDIRTRQDLRLPAANRLSFAFLGRTHSQCDDWQELLRTVQAETKWIKESRVYVDFLKGLALCQKQPRLFQWLLGRSRHMATAIFTYSGDIERGLTRIFVNEEGFKRVGDALYDGFYAAPPARCNTNIGIGFCLSCDRVSLSASWNRQALSQEEATKFLSDFAAAWRAWAR